MSPAKPVYGPISSYSRVQLLHLVQSRPGRTIKELADATELHPNTVREHLQRLMDGGYVIAEVERRVMRGRPRTLYSAATGEPEASSAVARDKVSAAARRGDLMRSIEPTTATELSREATYQLDALVEHLEESGFDPVVDNTQLTVGLTPCPHAVERPEDRPLLCQVHLGLMRGVLAEAGGPLRAACVHDGERPEQCTVQLSLGDGPAISGCHERRALSAHPEA